MKSYVVYNQALGRNVEIFRLDDNGNINLTGNLTLGENGVLTAASLNVTKEDEFEIVRDPILLEFPANISGSAIYYLGESVEAGDTYIKEGVEYTYSQSYTYGTWYEKYTHGYKGIIDEESFDPEMQLPQNFELLHNGIFVALSEGEYSHNKEVLDSYPTTTDIVVKAVLTEGDANGHWEIKYYNSDTLLYTDVTSERMLSDTGYNFPFTPLDADDYVNGNTNEISIPVSISKMYAVKPVDSWDLNDYMPLTGGTFTGSVFTRNIEPSPASTVDGVSPYSIGTSINRYNKGYFKEINGLTINAGTLNLDVLNTESFTLDSFKPAITPGDSLIIADNEDGYKLKKAVGSTFGDDSTKFLRNDGVFATPNIAAEESSDMSEVTQVSGKFVQYIGESNAFFTKDVTYIGTLSDDKYQIYIEGATFNNNKVFNAGIFQATLLNSSSPLITALNNLGIGTVESFIESQGQVTLIYTSEDNGWYIDGYHDSGIVSMNTVLALYNNSELLDRLITNNNLYITAATSTDVIKVTINKFIWNPLNEIQFDGVTTNKYLSKAGTWEDVPSSEGSSPEFHPATEEGEIGTEAKKYILADVVINSSTGEIIVNGLDELVTSGLYELRSSNSVLHYILDVKISNGVVKQTIMFPRWDEETVVKRTIPYQIMRSGTLNGSNVPSSAWTEWIRIYNPDEFKVVLDKANTWRTLSKDEWTYLISTRDNASSLIGAATVAGVEGVIILNDSGELPQSMSQEDFVPIASGWSYEDNVISKSFWDMYCKDKMLFLPAAGRREGSSVKKNTEYDKWTINYWTSTTDIDAPRYIKAFTLTLMLTGSSTTVNITDNYQYGNSVRLAKNVTNGAFSVGPNVTVEFAPGNLQYNCAHNIFRFAKNQYDCIRSNCLYTEDYGDMGGYNGWMDLFGYGTSGYRNNPSNISTNISDYTVGDIETDSNYDWGVYNPIYRILPSSDISCLKDDY